MIGDPGLFRAFYPVLLFYFPLVFFLNWLIFVPFSFALERFADSIFSFSFLASFFLQIGDAMLLHDGNEREQREQKVQEEGAEANLVCSTKRLIVPLTLSCSYPDHHPRTANCASHLSLSKLGGTHSFIILHSAKFIDE